MARLISSAVLALACFPAWAASPLLDEGYLLALQGEEPYASAAAEGSLLLPTQAEVDALPLFLRLRQQEALKRTLLHRELRARNSSRRLSTETMQACAQEARKLGAPESAIRLFCLLGDESQPRRRRAALLSELDALLRLYQIDGSAIHYYVRSSGLEEGELEQALPQLPLAALFNWEPEPDDARKAADRREYAASLARLVGLCQEIHDADSAEEATSLLARELLCQSSTAATRLDDAVQLQRGIRPPGYKPPSANILQSWAGQRQRLKEAGYYGSLRLRALLELLE